MEEEVEFEGQSYLKVLAVESLACMSSKAFHIDVGDLGASGGFIVRYESGGLQAYRNSCPHTGAPLNWTPDQFLTRSGRYIQCSIHGAMFMIDSGECFSGPCGGQFLKPLTVIERAGCAYIRLLDIQKSPSK